MSKLTDTALQRLAALDPFPQPPFVRVRHPVVLMHGFGVLAALRRGGHLHEEALYLRQHGVPAFAPNVAPYTTVPVRAATWKERLEQVLAMTGASKLNLIAHSMGGLDARFLISEMGFHTVVRSLTTVSTPHRGTSLALMAMEQPQRVRAWAVDFCNWMGSAAMNDTPSNAQQAVTELTPAYVCEVFNPSVPDHPSVQYWSFAGRAGKGTDVPINPFLIPLNHYLFKREGPNDGFISVTSAQWGTFQGTVDADHVRQVGIQVTPGGTFQSNEFYLSLVKALAEAGC